MPESKRVPVFVSYHGSDSAIAMALKESLMSVSEGGFDVFVDKYAIEAGDRYEERIAEAIERAQWFLIVYAGFPKKNVDMMWSFFEAGQFRATLPKELLPQSSKRIVCLFDQAPPAILSSFQGIQVDDQRRSRTEKINMAMLSPRENKDLDDTAIFNLLVQMLDNHPSHPVRNTKELGVQRDIREQSFRIISTFLAAGANEVIKDEPLQPRLSYELNLKGSLSDVTVVRGYDKSLDRLFSISTDETSWGEIVGVCCSGGKPKPVWMSDLEAAAVKIGDRKTPDLPASKCVLKDEVYRVYTSRYEIYKSEKRVVYVSFLPAVGKTFDLRRDSATLLSSLILSVRFRERLIPMCEALGQSADPAATMVDFYRSLLAIEIEAQQFGLTLDTDSGRDAPLASVVRDPDNRKIVEAGIDQWLRFRREIDGMFIADRADRNPLADARRLAQILTAIEPTNTRFIKAITEELLAEVRREEIEKRKDSEEGSGESVQ